MENLFVVSSQLPVHIEKVEKDFKIAIKEEPVKSGLENFYRQYNTKWIGLTSIDHYKLSNQEKEKLKDELQEYNCIPVFADWNVINDSVHGFSKETIWPLFHYFTQNAVYVEKYWNAYVKVNRYYAEKILQHVNKGDSIWIHDYHLLLLPGMIRDKRPEISIGIFNHIPFPSYEIFRLLPWRIEILEGMLGADLIAFHTYNYVRHFLSCVRRILGYDSVFNRIQIHERTLKVDAYPKGIDFEKFQKAAILEENKPPEKKSQIRKEIEKYFSPGEGKKIILSTSNLEHTKGIPDRLKAFEIFLRNNPEFCGKVCLILIAVSTGETGEMYHNLKSEVDELVGRINGNYGTINWMPIWYLYRPFELDDLIELYTAANIALITPIRDGMSMVAKEFVASKPDGRGVLILSETAGAIHEMNEALIVNPNNLEEIAEAIKQAILMPVEEQEKRNKVLQKRLKRYNVDRWARDFMKSLADVKKLQQTHLTKKINIERKEDIINDYHKTKNRIFLLDYDGTLTGFRKNPADAKPDQELYSILKNLSTNPQNNVVIISGRDKEILGKWFVGDRNISFIAEHGVWFKNPGENWSMLEQIDNEWKKLVHPILEFYVDQTPGAFIENKNFSLVWHYRKSDPDLGIQRSWELKDQLMDLISNLNLQIMDGDKVIEIKHSGINKGRAATYKMGDEKFDFILAIGDDWTDEYTFEALPDTTYTIKVGTKNTKARFYVESVNDVREFLHQISGK
ncbi:MAG: bifunctional alpha,alpha-trehalose-phosphate synthase (UDP-forming)/trehalose-phosphatase [Bacteroidetes bacterium]|nr:bifunctional alpha,alpha-trehalose-phosphate synthase (UDP-forming)/trehalose-phosphatase [Bacteroidota bacterium]